MPVSQSRLELILSEFPTYILRQIIEEKEIGFKSNQKQDLVDKLAEQGWSDDDVEGLKQRLKRVKEEQAQMSFFVLAINQAPDLRAVEEFLNLNSIERDEEGDVFEGGWEVIEITDRSLVAQKWKVTKDEGYDPFTDSRTIDETRESITVSIDLDEERVFIETTNYGKANSGSCPEVVQD